MGIVKRFFEFRDSFSSTISFPADYFAGWFGVAPAESGVEVNELTAMQIAAYVGCVRIISGAISTLPFRVWRSRKGEDQIADDHPLDNVLNNQPNPETTAADFWQTVVVHILLTGNSYSEVAFNGAGARSKPSARGAMSRKNKVKSMPRPSQKPKKTEQTREHILRHGQTIETAMLKHPKGETR